MQLSKKISISFFLIFMPVLLFSQVDTLRLNKYYAGKYWKDTKNIITAPTQWDNKDWTKFAVYTGTTAAIFLADEKIRDSFQSVHHWAGETGEKISATLFEPFGAAYSLIITGSFLTYGIIAKDGKSQSTGLLAAESFLLASAFVRLPKYMFGRIRPEEGTNVSPFDFDGPGGGLSFPSGHTIAVFSVASVIANQYASTKWVPMLSYSIAGLAGLSRIYDNKHWASDVFIGAVLGTVIGNMVCVKEKSDKISVAPFQSNSIKGINLIIKI